MSDTPTPPPNPDQPLPDQPAPNTPGPDENPDKSPGEMPQGTRDVGSS